MNVYNYDSTQIHYYDTMDLGSIGDATVSTVDHGLNFSELIVEPGDDYIVALGQDYIPDEITGFEDYEVITITETTYPVTGILKLSSVEPESASIVFVAQPEPIVLRADTIVVRKQAWTGSGTLFEIGSGLERMVAPYIGGSGPLRVSGGAHVSETNSHNEDSTITYGSDIDHGQILAAVGSSHDYGLVHGFGHDVVDEGETDFGTVVDFGGSNPFGLFSIIGANSTPNRIKSYDGSGSLFVASGGSEQFEEDLTQIYIVGRDIATGQFIRTSVIGLTFGGGNPEAFARVAYQGSGVLFGLSGGQEAKVYDYTSESVVVVEPSVDNGQITSPVGSYNNYGAVHGYGHDVVDEGEFDYGQVVITQTTSAAQGTLNVSGNASTSPARAFAGSGSLTLTKHIFSYGEGQGSQIAFLPHYRSTGSIHVTNHVVPDAFSRPYAGSGSLFKLGEKDERVSYDYTTESVVFVTDAIDNGTVAHGTFNTEDYGSVIGTSVGVTDHGQVAILQTTPSFGLFKFSGESGTQRSRDFVGSGQFKSYKGQAVVNAGQSSDFAFLPHWRGRGGITLTNHIIPDAFVRSHVGSGSLFEIGQKDERATFTYGIGSVEITVPEILLAPWNGTSEYTGSNISAVASGNGSGQSGGFNSSTTTYWKFTGRQSSNTSGTDPRILTLGPLDLTNYNQFEFTAIAGTSSNGGENCDADEDLEVWYSTDGGTTYTSWLTYDAEDVRFTGSTFGLVTVTLPQELKTSNVVLKFQQLKHSGTGFDEWGIEYVKVLESTATGSGQVYDTIDSVDQGTVDQSAGVNEDYGVLTTPFTNGIVDYGQLNPGLFKFGDLRISGGDSAHSNPRAYRGAIEHITEQPVQDITILPDDIVSGYNGQLINVTLSDSGTGLNNDGGFDIGRHVAFDGNTLRGVDFTVDTRNYDEIAITCIRGDGSNGGEEPDLGEDLKLGYSLTGGFPFTDLGVVLAEDSTDGISSAVRKIITLPAGAKSEVVTFRLYQAQGSNGIDDYGVSQIEILSDTSPTPFNLDVQPTSFTLSGAAGVQIQEPSTQIYIYGHRSQEASQGEFIKIGGGMSDIKVVKGAWIGSGSLNNSGVVIEKTSFDYNDSSIVTVETPIDNGDIGIHPTTYTDYGQVSEYGYGETNYGQVAILQTTQPFGKLYEWTGGDIAHSNPRAYNGTTAALKLTGGYSNLQFASQAGESTVLFRTSGGDSDKIVKVFTGTGSLFHIGDRVERRTFSYNTSSVAPTDQFTDNGLVIHTATNHSDYGQIIHDYDPALSHSLGYTVGVIGDENPFGKLFEFSGTWEGNFFPQFIWDRQSPAIRVFNDHQDPADFRFVPHWRTRYAVGSPRISNGPGGEFHTYAQSRPFIGGGRLFGLGDKFESATFRYTTESIVVVETPEDYGHITSHPTQNLDHGAVGSAITPGGEFDNGQVVITETTQSATGLYKFSGEGDSQFFRGPYVVKPTAIRIFNEQQDPADFRFSPHWRARPYEQGKLTGAAETPRARDFVGKGRLFGLGDKVESATFRYTTGSIVVVETPEDHGLITSTPTQNLDFGSVGSDLTPGGEVDFGQIIITETTQSATGLYKLSGDGGTQFFRGPYSGKGEISFYKGQSADTDFRFMPHWRGVPDEQFKVSGVAHSTRARDFVGSGSLFHIGDKIERRVYDYTTESIAVVQPTENYGSITTTASGTLDHGSVGSDLTPGGEVDFGQVVITQTTQPFGLFRFRGGGHGAVKTAIPPTNTFELSISGSAIEKFTSGDDENTILFNFTGDLTESFSKGNYAGSGSLFHIGDRIERRTYHYNTSSVVLGTTYEDDGTIGSAHSTAEDYGLIANATVPPTTDYGDLVILPGDENPFGLFKITGGDSGHKQTFREVGSGSLFTTIGTSECVGFNPPEETFLFGFSGGAVEKHVENWVGSGLIKYPEDTPLAPNAAVRFRPWWRGVGGATISGFGDVDSRLINYVSRGGSLNLYTNNPGLEWRSYRPSPRYVNSVYGQIGGTFTYHGNSDTRKINVYQYYGDLAEPGTSGSLFTFNSATEVAGYNPATETVLFSASGTSPSKWNPAWTSRLSGSPRLSGTPELQLRFNIFTNLTNDGPIIRGNNEPVITLSHFGSGSLFNAGSGAEVVGFNPETDTRAFTFSGTPIVKINLRIFGGGQIFGFGGAAESATIDAPESTVLFVSAGSADTDRARAYEGTGTEFISGNAEDSRTRTHIGEGSLFGTGGAAEAVSVTEAESTVLFTASGGEENAFVRSAVVTAGATTLSNSADDSFARPYTGEGSLFGIGGAAESVAVDEESIGLFTFKGSAEPVLRTRGFAGSGSLFSVGNAAEVVAVVPETTGLFRISGEAEAPFARIVTGTGTTFVSGDGEFSRTVPYEGEGSFSTFGGAAEVAGFDPAEETFLYEFSGNADSTRARSFAGSGSATVLNEDVVPVITLSFVGDGSFSTFGGAAESKTVDEENITLFHTRGAATESFSKGTYNADGSATISGEASDIKLTFGNEVFAYASVSGNLVEKQTDSYAGSGSLFGFSSGAVARAVDYNETTVGAQGELVSTNLFTIFGNNPGSVTRITQPTTAQFVTSCEAKTRLFLFSPPRKFGTII